MSTEVSIRVCKTCGWPKYTHLIEAERLRVVRECLAIIKEQRDLCESAGNRDGLDQIEAVEANIRANFEVKP